MSRLPLTVALSESDRVRTLFDGTIAIEGVDANLLALPVEEIFFRAVTNREFDVCELSFSSYMIGLSRGALPYLALPIFLSRAFRHSAIYVHADRNIHKPADLKGRTVGMPEYQLTACLWVRGLLADEYGVQPKDIHWRLGGVESPGRKEKIAVTPPPGVDIQAIGPEDTLSAMLLDGRIDALICPRAPSIFRKEPKIVRLFADFRAVEHAYFAKTGIFPIMHVLAVRQELIERNPWLPASLCKAFGAAKDRALHQLDEVAALPVALPWLAQEVEETRALMGADWWPYGVEKSRKTLEAAVRHSFEQGLSARKLSVEELFAKGTDEQFKI